MIFQWRFACRGVWIMTCILILVAVPELAIAMRRANFATHAIAWFVAGVFVLMALPVSAYEVAQHLDNYTKPLQQKKIIRILFMVPVYAIDSWLALRFKDKAIAIDTVRECYEAYVIYSFFEYLLCYIGDEQVLARYLSEKPQTPHIWPFSLCMNPWKMGEEFVKNCKAGVHGYVVVRPATTIIALFCEWGGVYGNGSLDSHKAFLYLTFINNVSQVWALYCLVLFYNAAHEELRTMKPFAKFLCVKSVVFFSFWQSLAIAVLVKAGIISGKDSLTDYDINDKVDVATALQDFLICVEMFFAALAHCYAFSVTEYMDLQSPKKPFSQSVVDMFDVSDITSDMFGRVNMAGEKVVGTIKSAVFAIHTQYIPRSEMGPTLVSVELGDLRVDEGQALLEGADVAGAENGLQERSSRTSAALTTQTLQSDRL